MGPLRAIEGGRGQRNASAEAQAVTAGFLAEHCRGDADALFNLAIAFATGSAGLSADFVEAHRWFNIAAANGHPLAASARADIAEEMTAREIADAQRLAREWLRRSRRQAA
ncbi:hypothetical protein EYB45_04100 [Erythrobacteraceae bacterium CFH 75059]|uniref:SEL1-like repeat protein n=1 Tax=Qipengyuania thermophila TaxID=2509361 RepID=UPI00101EB06D|nr:SEL1-like repeat protein [Qipengyuania thermophila]TCD06865.1 hypothetical protein EYB45_04100 [Erythrobacteraceae bacterium CFH 75059]